MLTPIGDANLVQRVVQQMLKHIANGDFKIGDRLPSERVLADKLSVSRTCIRESIKILQTMGVIDVQHGKGTFVVNTSPRIGNSSIWRPWLMIYRDDVIDLLDVREALEIKAIDLASIDRWESIEKDLARILYQMEEALTKKDIERLVALDIEFHELLCQAGNNSILTSLSKEITTVLSVDRRAVLEIPARAELSISQHKKIFEAIKQKNRKAAREALSDHVKSVKEQIVKITEEDYRTPFSASN